MIQNDSIQKDKPISVYSWETVLFQVCTQTIYKPQTIHIRTHKAKHITIEIILSIFLICCVLYYIFFWKMSNNIINDMFFPFFLYFQVSTLYYVMIFLHKSTHFQLIYNQTCGNIYGKVNINKEERSFMMIIILF